MNMNPSTFWTASVTESDPALAASLTQEMDRQQTQIELIASENIASRAVLEAQGSVLTNKYAEGYAGKRYYGGCEYVDIAEELAVERAKQLYNCSYVNVQPHSGAQANAAVMLALMAPGDTFLGMSLAHGGHLTHGSHVNCAEHVGQVVQPGALWCAQAGRSAGLRRSGGTGQRA